MISDPKGAGYRPQIIPTNPPIYSEQNTVMAHNGCNSGSGPVPPDVAPTVPPAEPERASAGPTNEGSSGTAAGLAPQTVQGDQQRLPPPARTDSNPVIKLPIDELLHLAPRLRPYLTSPQPAWPEIVDAADWLRGELGVSKSLWGEACIAMGREQAAIAIASSRPSRRSISARPGRVFPRHGGEGEERRAQPRRGRSGACARRRRPNRAAVQSTAGSVRDGRWVRPPSARLRATIAAVPARCFAGLGVRRRGRERKPVALVAFARRSSHTHSGLPAFGLVARAATCRTRKGSLNVLVDFL